MMLLRASRSKLDGLRRRARPAEEADRRGEHADRRREFGQHQIEVGHAGSVSVAHPSKRQFAA